MPGKFDLPAARARGKSNNKTIFSREISETTGVTIFQQHRLLRTLSLSLSLSLSLAFAASRKKLAGARGVAASIFTHHACISYRITLNPFLSHPRPRGETPRPAHPAAVAAVLLSSRTSRSLWKRSGRGWGARSGPDSAKEKGERESARKRERRGVLFLHNVRHYRALLLYPR